jgi:hypothetical protein
LAGPDHLPAGKVLKAREGRGFAGGDRVLHGLERLENKAGRWCIALPALLVKERLEIERR